MDDAIYAVLVGAETYHVDGASDVHWDLNGPASDVLAVGECLIARAVAPERIHFIASPLDRVRFENGMRACALPQNWHGAPTRAVLQDVFEHKLLQAIDRDGNTRRPGVLFLYWSGHGAIDQIRTDNERRMVFCADRHDGGQGILSVSALVNTLGRMLRSFKIILIIDACAVDLARMKLDDLAELKFPGGERRHVQSAPGYIVYSTTSGDIAINLGARGVGLFSEIFLDELRKPAPAATGFCEVVEQAYERARPRVFAASEQRQIAVSHWVHGWQAPPGWYHGVPVRPALAHDTAADLCDRIAQWATLKPAMTAHFEAHPRQPFALLAHCGPNQYPLSLCKRIEFELGQDPHPLGRQRATIAVRELLFDLPPAPEDMVAALDSALGKAFSLRGRPDRQQLARRIADLRTCQVLLLRLNASMLQKDAARRLAAIFDYLQRFPDIGGDAAVITVVVVENRMPAGRITEIPILGRFFGRERGLRAILGATTFHAHGLARPVPCIQPPLGNVTADDIRRWALETQPGGALGTAPDSYLERTFLHGAAEQPLDHVLGNLPPLLTGHTQLQPRD